MPRSWICPDPACHARNGAHDDECGSCGETRPGASPRPAPPSSPPVHRCWADESTHWRCACGEQYLSPPDRQRALRLLTRILDHEITPQDANRQIAGMFAQMRSA